MGCDNTERMIYLMKAEKDVLNGMSKKEFVSKYEGVELHYGEDDYNDIILSIKISRKKINNEGNKKTPNGR